MTLVQLVSFPLQKGFRFFRYPIPASHVGLPYGLLTHSKNGRNTGLPCFTSVTNKRVRSCLFHRQCFMSVCPQNSREQPTAYLFGSSLSIPLARCTLRCLSDSSLSLTIPLSQAPRAEWYYQPLTSPRGSVSSFRKGYLVGTASYKGITPYARVRRLLQTELEV